MIQVKLRSPHTGYGLELPGHDDERTAGAVAGGALFALIIAGVVFLAAVPAMILDATP